MKVIKKIGNNAAICEDSKNRELVAIGKGIGFPKCPYELDDLSVIDRTFYGVDSHYLSLIEEIDASIFELSANIIDVASLHLEVELSPNAVFTLADHLNFAIDRIKKGIIFDTPLSNELDTLYEKEVKIAKYAIKLIKKQKNIDLPKSELYGIVLNLINSEMKSSNDDENKKNQIMIDDVAIIIQNHYNIKIKKDTFNYSRFSSHMQYMMKRKNKKVVQDSQNKIIYQTLITEFPMTYQCALKIKEYFIKNMQWNLSEEELLYLILHINRLCTREGCN